MDDDKAKKELYMSLIQLNLLKALSQLRLITQEEEILVYKEKLQKDQDLKAQYDVPQPKIPLKYFHIPVNHYLS